MLVIRGAYIRRGLNSGGAYIRDFTVCLSHTEIDLIPLNDSMYLKTLELLRLKFSKFDKGGPTKVQGGGKYFQKIVSVCVCGGGFY